MAKRRHMAIWAVWPSATICLFLFILLAFAPQGQRLRLLVSRSGAGYPPQRAAEFDRAKNYLETFREARGCAETRWVANGISLQRRLAADHVSFPPLERPSPIQRRETMSRGSLNSLAHCSILAAEAATQLGMYSEALKWYRSASQLTYARVYDEERKEFWSPAQRAREALARVETLADAAISRGER